MATAGVVPASVPVDLGIVAKIIRLSTVFETTFPISPDTAQAYAILISGLNARRPRDNKEDIDAWREKREQAVEAKKRLFNERGAYMMNLREAFVRKKEFIPPDDREELWDVYFEIKSRARNFFGEVNGKILAASKKIGSINNDANRALEIKAHERDENLAHIDKKISSEIQQAEDNARRILNETASKIKREIEHHKDLLANVNLTRISTLLTAAGVGAAGIAVIKYELTDFIQTHLKPLSEIPHSTYAFAVIAGGAAVMFASKVYNYYVRKRRDDKTDRINLERRTQINAVNSERDRKNDELVSKKNELNTNFEKDAGTIRSKLEASIIETLSGLYANVVCNCCALFPAAIMTHPELSKLVESYESDGLERARIRALELGRSKAMVLSEKLSQMPCNGSIKITFQNEGLKTLGEVHAMANSHGEIEEPATK
ncbi:MAG: hypothetical protein NT157_02740 [Candidatus Micrarchaeota archaeon]|nr:hypothetical protein [Candidatus Micrarchaeota archaeon]